MDIQSLKIDLAKKILQTNQPALLHQIEQLIKQEEKNDWWDELPLEIQDSINQGLEESKTENGWSHEQVVQEARQKYGY
jgi:thiamine pyrophosphate-dependent acetolactate synthase large subunit-like protein